MEPSSPQKETVNVDLSGAIESQNEDETSSWLPSSFASSTRQFFPAKTTVAREWISKQKEGLRSWREFVKSDRFHIPRGIGIVGKRVARNIDHFQSNYLCVFIVLLIYCIITSPLLLVALAACFGLVYLIRVKNLHQKLRYGGKELSPAGQYAIVAVLAFPLFYIAGAGSIIFWVIGASIFLIVSHAIFYASEPVPGADFIQMEDV